MNQGTLKPKERIVATASKLFYENDIHSVGVDRISEESNVSKRTLYKYFSTKEILIAYCLERQAQSWFEGYISMTNDTPAQNIRSVFESLETRTEESGFQGCPFMNTSIEVRGSQTTAFEIAALAKKQMFRFFENQLIALGVENPKSVAESLVVLFDGSNAWYILNGTFPMSTMKQIDNIIGHRSLTN